MMNKVIKLATLIRNTANVELFADFSRTSIYIRDCHGFDEDWRPIFVELPDEVSEIIALAKELNYIVEFASDDV